MKPWQLGSILALGVASLAGSSAVPPATAGSGPSAPVWMSDYEAARVAARRTGRPLFVAFR